MTAKPWILVASALLVCPLMIGAQKPPKPPKPGDAATPAIAYWAVNGSGYFDLMVMDADGSNQVRLVRGGDNMRPAWSPDGEWIAFVRAWVAVPGIYMVRPNGTGLCLIAPTQSSDGGLGITWSPEPDASGDYWIVYSDRGPGTKLDLFASRAVCGASERRQLTNMAGDESWPAWSPDGRLAAYVDGDINVFNVLPAGGDGIDLVHVANLTSSGPLAGGDTYGASWTPDGTELLVSGTGQENVYNLWVISSSEPGVAAQLTSTSGLAEGKATWSPDATQIAFARGGDIYVAGIARVGGSWTLGQPVRLLDARKSVSDPAWRQVP